MKKIWCFLEGDTEEYFIANLFRKKLFSSCLQEKDLLKFVNEDFADLSRNLIYCENCHSVDKIPHRINEMYHFIERSGAADILVVCDVEKLKCNITRTKAIESKFDDCVDKNMIKYSFFKPRIESAYWECPQIIKKIVEIEYKEKFSFKKKPSIFLPGNISNSQFALKQLFKEYNLKYRETKFAEEFFPRVNYEECENITLKRIYNFLMGV